jgi:hypothetical protein
MAWSAASSSAVAAVPSGEPVTTRASISRQAASLGCARSGGTRQGPYRAVAAAFRRLLEEILC